MMINVFPRRYEILLLLNNGAFREYNRITNEYCIITLQKTE